MKSSAIAIWLGLLVAPFVLPGNAVAGTTNELKALREEVAALREGQERMQKDLDEVKKLLQQGARAAPAQQAFKPADLRVGDSPFLGSADAPVTLVEFSDYQCPFCKRHATTVMPEIVKQYVDAGKVRIVMREFPIENIHTLALGAAKAALCARDQGNYWQMHDLIFADQKALEPGDLKAHAATLGLDTAAFDSCLDGDRRLAEIRASQAEGQKLGISGTPSFVAGVSDPEDNNTVHLTRFIRGAQALPTFQQNLDDLLKEAAGGE